jgi:RNA polymerase sigma-70 factor, ECF subfamily
MCTMMAAATGALSLKLRIIVISCGILPTGSIQRVEVPHMLPVLERETAMVQNEGAKQPADNESDAGLLRRYFKHGDGGAMTQFYKRHADSAYRIAFACTGNAADAEEVLQTAFVQLLTKGAELCAGTAGPNANIRGWLMSVVINASKMNARAENSRRQREEAVAPPEKSSVEISPERRELIAAAVQSVNALPVLYRLPVSLHYIEGLSIDEISSTLSIPQKTLRSQISRGLEQIREALTLRGFSAAALPIHELIAAAPLATAPASAAISFHALVNSGVTKTAAAASNAGALLMKVATAVVALLLATTVIIYRSGPLPENSPPKDDKTPSPVTVAAELPKEIDPKLAEILAKKIDANYQRHYLKEVLDELQESCGLRSVYPESLRNVLYTWNRKNVTVKQVLDHLAIEGLQYEYHGTTLAIWKPASDPIVVRLEKVMRDGSADARSEAVCQMGSLADKRVCKILVDALNDKDPDTKMWATFSLVAFRSMLPYVDVPKDLSAGLLNDLPGKSEYRGATLRLISALREPGAEKLLIELLRHADPSVREGAAEGLKNYTSHESIGAVLAEALENEQDEGVRINVTQALHGTTHPRAINSLFKLLSRSNFSNIEAATIASIGREQLEPKLETVLAAPDEIARGSAAKVLAYVRGDWRERAYQKLVAVLDDPSARTRSRAAWAMGFSGNPDAAAVLIKLLEREQDQSVKDLAYDALARLRNSDATRWLLAEYSRVHKDNAASLLRALGHTRDDRAEAIILPMFASDNHQLVCMAIVGADALRTSAVLDATIKATQSAHDLVRWHAAINLAWITHPAAIDATLGFLTNAPQKRMPGVAATFVRRYLSQCSLKDRLKIIAALEAYEKTLRPADPLPANGDF